MEAEIQPQFKPENDLERVLVDAKSGRVDVSRFLSALLANPLYILSTEQVKDDGRGLVPLIFNRNGIPMAAVFTAKSRTKPLMTDAQFLVQMDGKSFFQRIPDGYGIVVNPRSLVGLEITPPGIKEILRDFVIRSNS